MDKVSTAKTYKSILNKFAEYLSDEGIGEHEFNDDNVREYLEQSDYSPKTQDDIIGCLKGYAKWYKRQKVNWDDFQNAKKEEQRMDTILGMLRPKVPKRQKRKALRKDEIDKLITGLKGKNASFLFLSCYFGMRPGEFRQIEEIDYDKPELKVLGEKDLVERILPFSEKIVPVLRKADRRGWLERSYDSIYRALKGRRTLVDGVKLTPHSGRHTFRSEMDRRIADDGIVDTLLGHGEGKIRNIYDDPAYEYLQEAMREKHYLRDFDIPEALKL